MSWKNIGLVTEGGTDYDLLSVLLDELLGPEIMLTWLQPSDSSPENGSGWKGIRRWCEQTLGEYGSLENYRNGIEPKLDGIILQIDGDVVFEHDIGLPSAIVGEARERMRRISAGLEYDIFPITRKNELLADIVNSWLPQESGQSPLLCKPIDELETWIVAAYDAAEFHNPPELPIEALVCPADSVIGRSAEYHGIRVHRKDGRLKKSRSTFRGFHGQVIRNWETVTTVCSAAASFEAELKAAIPG